MEKPTKGFVVDGSTRGNPGPSQYQIYDLEKKEIIFNSGWLDQPTTNNICEFLGLCTGILMSVKAGGLIPVYSDSQTAIAWVKKMQINSSNSSLKHRTDKALNFLKRNTVEVRIEKWHTAVWGENPADFGNKQQ
jgi:ribonuclease HI